MFDPKMGDLVWGANFPGVCWGTNDKTNTELVSEPETK